MHQDIAFRTACVIARNTADAEEAAQDGFVKAYRALGRFREGAPFRPWLLQIVANEARNRRRSAGAAGRAVAARRRRRGLGGRGSVPRDDRRRRRAARPRCWRRSRALREDDQAVLGCRFLVGLSEQETAAALGLRRGTVKSRTAPRTRAAAHPSARRSRVSAARARSGGSRSGRLPGDAGRRRAVRARDREEPVPGRGTSATPAGRARARRTARRWSSVPRSRCRRRARRILDWLGIGGCQGPVRRTAAAEIPGSPRRSV